MLEYFDYVIAVWTLNRANTNQRTLNSSEAQSESPVVQSGQHVGVNFTSIQYEILELRCVTHLDLSRGEANDFWAH